MRCKNVLNLVFCLCLAGAALAQTSNQGDDAKVTGKGTPNHLVKFTGNTSVGNTKIVESGGNISTPDSLNASAVSATMNRAPGVASFAANETTNGSVDYDAALSSGIQGVFGVTGSPAGVGVYGENSATTGDPIGVLGKTHSTDRGIGVRGGVTATTGLGIGVLGEAASANQFGMIGVNGSSSGYPIGMFGYVLSADGGMGILGRAWSVTGNGIGVKGETLTANGVGGSFENTVGGDILYGLSSGTIKFRVDGTGRAFADGGFQPGGADFAEAMAVTGDRARYEPGDLLVIDPSAGRHVALAQHPYSTLVAGIYSTKPGMLGTTRKVNESAPLNEIPLAVVGIVPCKVTTDNGPIQIGDLLVTSSTAGHAMRGTERSRMLGAVVGKALEPLSDGQGVIQVLVTLQ
jgi:hypothetical protein